MDAFGYHGAQIDSWDWLKLLLDVHFLFFFFFLFYYFTYFNLAASIIEFYYKSDIFVTPTDYYFFGQKVMSK